MRPEWEGRAGCSAEKRTTLKVQYHMMSIGMHVHCTQFRSVGAMQQVSATMVLRGPKRFGAHMSLLCADWQRCRRLQASAWGTCAAT